MLADKVMMTLVGGFTGIGTYQLFEAVGAFQTWRAEFATGASGLLYAAQNQDGTIWELGFGTLNYGPPDTLSRTLLRSSTGSLIDWQATDAPIYVYSPTSNQVVKFFAAPLAEGPSDLPGWLQKGMAWLDHALGITTAWVKKRYIDGDLDSIGSHIEEGRYYITPKIFAASQRRLFVDKGAANYVFTADDVGKVLCFDCTAATRTLTMLESTEDGMGHSAYVDVLPYGSTANGVTFTPGGSETTDLATAPPGRVTRFTWDGAKSKWRADYVAPVIPPILTRGCIAGLTLSTAGSSSTFSVAAGAAADSTGAALMKLAASISKTTGAWAVGSGNGALDTGTIANDTWYAAYLIQRPDTGVYDVLITKLTAGSAPAPTLPTNYTLSRYLGSMKTDGSGHWVKFIQVGDEFRTAPAAGYSTTVGGGPSLQTFGGIPPGIVVRPIGEAQAGVNGGSTSDARISIGPAADSSMIETVAYIFSDGSGGGTGNSFVGPPTNTSAQIYVQTASTGAGSYGMSITTTGWIDRRGQDD